jgi:hypothetical protein
LILANSTGISEVDNNNNNSKNLYTNEFFFNQREFGYDTQMNIHERSHIIIAEQLTIIDAVGQLTRIDLKVKEQDHRKSSFFLFSGIIETCFTS